MHSDTASINSSFILGSGSINSSPQYSYFILNNDGSKEKKFVDSNGTKIFEGDYEQPYLQETKCKSGEEFSLVVGYFIETKEEKCEKLLERKLFVPKNTIILEYNVK